MKFISVGMFANKSNKQITLFLEVDCEEVRMQPGHEVELLIEDVADALPVTILYQEDGMQIYPNLGNPSWRLKFKGKEIQPGWPTLLIEHE